MIRLKSSFRAPQPLEADLSNPHALSLCPRHLLALRLAQVNIERAINDIDSLLRIYADDSKPATEERLGDLQNILRDDAKFAFLLSSQPYFWQFDCQSEPANHLSENLVMFPSLLRVTDRDGKWLAEPVVLGKKGVLKDE